MYLLHLKNDRNLCKFSCLWLSFLILFFCLLSYKSYSAEVAVQLANIYDDSLNVKDYLISEKYDGIGAIWKEGELQSRNGNIIHAPDWFISSLPDVWLDGELWSKRQDFEFIASTVSKLQPVELEWQQIKYMVFDAPNFEQSFQLRADYYSQLIKQLNLPHLIPIEQKHIGNNEALSQYLTQLVDAGAEGLILHKADALFQDGRSDNLLKLKPYMDSEAKVLEYLPGKGKYKGLMGSIRVRWKTTTGEGIEFNIGSGFSDEERANPPPIGSIITFRYHGLTKNNIPRFASYMRIRQEI